MLRVAEQTVASRQLLSDQVSALTSSKLKSALDLSFANVNLAQAKLLYLDALNNDQAAMAALSAILGYPTLENLELISDSGALSPPPADVDRLIGDALDGDGSLFTRQDASEIAWRIFDPILGNKTPVHGYDPGTWGPAAAMASFQPAQGWVDPTA